jgi:type IV pilus assembly protein PilY1
MTTPVSLRARSLCAALAGLMVGTSVAAAPAQLPLMVKDGSQGKPNIVFTFDDSGSMSWSFVPDAEVNVTGGAIPVMHPKDSLPVHNNWPCVVRSVAPANATVNEMRLRTPTINTIYYNPVVRYVPWGSASGGNFGNSPPTAAYVDPLAIVAPAKASTLSTVNLTAVGNSAPNLVSGTTEWCNVSNTKANPSASTASIEYRPAVYFTVTSTGYSVANFTQIDLNNAAVVLPLKDAGRTDCVADTSAAPKCTRAEELQNFANWFTYYRTRNLAAKGAVSRAFGAQGESMRLGYGRINNTTVSALDGVNTKTVQRGVRDFTLGSADRQAFFDWLYTVPFSGGTPLRRATDDVGQYFKRADNRGPWGNTPGSDDSAAHLECRKSYHILMTDGMWNNNDVSGEASTSQAHDDNDGVSGPTHVSATGATYTYSAVAPYKDPYFNNLADVASYYWKNDLRPDLANRVKPDASNPAFWQNLVQFTVGFGVGGTLNPTTDWPAIKAGTLAWPQAVGDTPTAVDDLWHAAVNSAGTYLSARNPDQFTQSLSAILADIANRQASEAGVSASSTSLQAGNRKFVPRYKTKLWTGELEAWELDAKGQAVGTKPVWSASESIPAAAARNITVWKDATAKAVAFDYATMNTGGVLSDMALTGTAVQNEALVNYLRGDTSKDGTDYRKRTSRLGDIVNSPPTFVKDAVDLQYNFLPSGVAGQSSYSAFLAAKAARKGVVYVGANDGMLHAFDNGTKAVDGQGVELFAFVPRAVLPNLSLLSSSSYGHRYYVDGPLVETDVYVGGGWKNLLLGSTGAGGRSVFAIDVTDPTALSGSKVLWEFNSSTDGEVGYVMGVPEAGLMANGQWAVVFGNGVESSSGKAQLFIVNAQTGALIKRIDTGVGSGNGLGGVKLIKNATNQVVGAYAGDLKGNVWRFDLQDAAVGNWKVGFNGSPLATVASTGGTVQPIVAAPEYLEHPKGGALVVLGTGKLLNFTDVDDTSAQSLYGLWDKTPIGDASVAGAQITNLSTALITQTISTTAEAGAGGATYYVVSGNTVDWATKRGWRLNLGQAGGQRLLSSPQWVGRYALFGTVAPAGGGATTNSCDASDGLGFNLLLNPLTGGTPAQAVFDTNGDGKVDKADKVVAGYRTDADGRDAVMVGDGDTPGKDVGCMANSSGVLCAELGTRTVQRIWRQIVNTP